MVRAALCLFTLVVWGCFETVWMAPARATPRTLCNKYRAKPTKGFNFAKCETEMKTFLEKVTDTDYHMLPANCVDVNISPEFCADTIIHLVEKKFQVKLAYYIITGGNVKTKEDVRNITKQPIEYWKQFESQLTVWGFAKEIATDEDYRKAITDYMAIDENVRASWVLHFDIVCVVGKAVKDKNLSKEDLTLLYQSLNQTEWTASLLQDLLSSSAMKKATVKQLKLVLEYTANLAHERQSYNRVGDDLWPYDEMPFLNNIPTGENENEISQFKIQIGAFKYLLSNVFPLPLYKQLKEMAVNKGIPENFIVDFLCCSAIFSSDKDNLHGPGVYKDMVKNLAEIYNRNKTVLNEDEMNDFNKALLVRKINNLLRKSTHAPLILNAANESGLDMKQVYDFIKTDNYSMEQYLVADSIRRLAKLKAYDVFDHIRAKNIVRLYHYIDICEDEDLKTGKDVILAFFKSNAKNYCKGDLIELIVKFNDKLQLTEDQKMEAVEAICEMSPKVEVNESDRLLFLALEKKTEEAKTYEELMSGLKSFNG